MRRFEFYVSHVVVRETDVILDHLCRIYSTLPALNFSVGRCGKSESRDISSLFSRASALHLFHFYSLLSLSHALTLHSGVTWLNSGKPPIAAEPNSICREDFGRLSRQIAWKFYLCWMWNEINVFHIHI